MFTTIGAKLGPDLGCPRYRLSCFVYGCLKENPDFSLALLVGFVLLLRPGEIVDLRLSCFTAAGPDLMVVQIWGKQSSRTGEWDTVLLRDPGLIAIISRLKQTNREFIFDAPSAAFTRFYREALSFFKVVHPKPTPHGIRRGGATWRFSLFGKYDVTQEHGRWAQVSTARSYIDQATSAVSESNLNHDGSKRLAWSQKLFHKLLSRHFSS